MAVRLSVGADERTTGPDARAPGPAEPFAGLAFQTGGARFRRELRLRRWGALHRRLATQPVFAVCSRAEIRAIARFGDEVSVEAGRVLWREDNIGYHFVVVVSGELALTRKGRAVGTLQRGDYAGDVAILGFGPQLATLTAKTDCRVFVVGRVALLSLVHTTGVRAGLFGDVGEDEARERIRGMRAEGKAAWRRRCPVAPAASAVVLPDSFRFYARPAQSTPPRWSLRLDRQGTDASATAARLSRRVRIVLAASVAAAVLIPVFTVSVTSRPRIALVTPATPIDVAADVQITGARTSEVHGRYVLTAVRVRRPTYAQWLVAKLGDATTASLAEDQAAASTASRAAFADAKFAAVRAAASVLSMDPAKLRVAIAPRDLGGPSVSLIYALTVADMLDPADLARGRTIAATGQLDADGRVGRVRFVAEKARVARASGATLFLVPPGQSPVRAGITVVEVATLADAVAALRA